MTAPGPTAPLDPRPAGGPRTMRAVVHRRYGPPEVLALVDVPVPVPRAGEVLVRVRATTVTAADAAFRSAEPASARLATGLRRPRRPVLGGDVAGEVVEVGDGVADLAAGVRVVGVTGIDMGCHAELVRLPAAGVVPLPDGVDAEAAVAVVEGGLTALPFLRDHGPVRPGHRVLVIGASGGVGTAAVQLAVHLGAEVTGVCSTPNVALVRELGAADVVDRTRADVTAGDARFDVVLDAVGASSYRRCRRVLRPGGVYLATTPGLGVLARSVWTPGSTRVRFAATGLRSTADKARDVRTLLDLHASGALRPVVDSRYPLADAAAAHRRVDTHRKRGVVVLVP